MENVFDKINKTMPKATAEELEQLDEDITVAPIEQFKSGSKIRRRKRHRSC